MNKEELEQTINECKMDNTKLNNYGLNGSDLLRDSIIHNHSDVFNWLLEKEANVNVIYEDEMTPLSYACRFGNPYFIQKIINKSSNGVKEVSYPMYFAIHSKKVENVSFLLNAGYSSKDKYKDGERAIHTVLRLINETKSLIGEKPEKADVERIELLKVLNCLFKSGVYFTKKDKKAIVRMSSVGSIFNKPVAYYCYQLEFDDLLKALIECGLGTHEENLDFKTIFEYFIESEEIELIKHILNYSDLDSINHVNALLASYKHPEITKLLLEGGVDPNKTERYTEGKTVMHYVTKDISEYYNKDFVRLLLEYGANVNAKNKYNWSPIIELLLFRDDLQDKQLECFNLIMDKEPIIDGTCITHGLNHVNKPVEVNDIFDLAVYQGRFEWFEPYVTKMPADIQELHESKKLAALLTDKSSIKFLVTYPY